MADNTQELSFERGKLEFTPSQSSRFDALYSVFFNRRFEEVMNQLAARDFQVLIALLRFCEFGNDIHISRAILSRRTGMAVNHISTSLKKLEKSGIITVIKRGSRYQLNERYFWRGQAGEYNERRRETRRRQAADEI